MIIGNSFSPMFDNNPSFTKITYDKTTNVITNINSYYFDIYKANKEGKGSWMELYDFNKRYNVKDLSLSSMKKVFQSFLTNSDNWVAYKAYRTALYDLERTKNMCEQISKNADDMQACTNKYKYQ